MQRNLIGFVRFHPEHWLNTVCWIKLICVGFENAASWTRPCLVQKKVRVRCLSSGPWWVFFLFLKTNTERERERFQVVVLVVKSPAKPDKIRAFRMNCPSMLSKAKIHDADQCKLRWIDLSGIWNPLNDPQERNLAVLKFLLMFSF